MAQNYQCNDCGKQLSCYYSVWRHKKKSCKLKTQQRSNEALAPKTYDIRKDAAPYPTYKAERSMKKSKSSRSSPKMKKNFKCSKCVKSYASSQSLWNHKQRCKLAEKENQDFVEELDGSLGRLSDEEISMILESRYKENLAKEAAELKRQRYQHPRHYKRSRYHEIQQLNKILDDDDE